MATPPTPGSTFTIPPSPAPISDGKGSVTQVWYRFFSSLFVAGGGGTPTNVTTLVEDVADLESRQALLYQPSGPDLHNVASIAQARQFASWGM